MAFPDSLHKERDQILVQSNSHVRTLILNRPQKLNVLSYEMVSQLLKNFKAFEEDSDVKLVILKGKGKAFCTGGDVISIIRSSIYGHWIYAAKFYSNQLTLDYILATYKKPQVCLIDGMIMGGGAGLSMNGKFRVVTEKTVKEGLTIYEHLTALWALSLRRTPIASHPQSVRERICGAHRNIFAMPEASLGLFPDVGASYFLSRLSGFFGEYIGLTGTKLDGVEMVACGLATHFVLSTNLPLLEEELNKVDSSDLTIISTIIDAFSLTSILKEDSVYRRIDIINKCFSKGTVEEILSALEYEAINKTDEWIGSAVKSLKTSSPMGLKVFLKSIREGRTQGIDQCLIREYKMACHAIRRTVTDDFFEGCRAVFFDKDKRPKWNPSKLELVSKEMVDQYFTIVDDYDWEELQLPIRSNSTKLPTSKL